MAPKRSSSPAPKKEAKAAKGSPAPPRPPSAKGSGAPASPAPVRKSASSAPPARMKASGSEDNLEGMGETGASTPLDVGSRIKAWVRVTTGAATGVDSEDQIGVRSEAAETGVVVYAADGLGRKLSSATVDGVISESQQVGSAHGDLLEPLVAQVVGPSALALSCLMCYGDEPSGRPEGIFGGDNLLITAVDRILAKGGGGGSTLHIGASIISMELLMDLFDTKSELTINETQFSGLHIDGGTWRPVTSAAQITHVPLST